MNLGTHNKNQQKLVEIFRTNSEEIFAKRLWDILNKRSGYFKLPNQQICNHPEHNPPTHLYIPQGYGYTHTCPRCKKTVNLIPPQITC